MSTRVSEIQTTSGGALPDCCQNSPSSLEDCLSEILVLLDSPRDGGRWLLWDDQRYVKADKIDWEDAPICENDKRLLQSVLQSVNMSIQSAKKGKVQESREFLEELRRKIDAVPFFGSSRLLLDSMLSAAVAYAYYRLGLRELADAEITFSMDCDEELETSYDWHSRHMHRIHLVENKMRIRFRLSDSLEGLEIACELLSYLSGTGTVLPYRGRWGRELVERLNSERIELKSIEICNQVAAVLSRGPAAMQSYFLMKFKPLSRERMPLLPPHSTVKYWLRVRIAGPGSDESQMLATLHEWLSSGYPIDLGLFCDAMLELGRFCRSQGETRLFQRVLVPKLLTWQLSSRLFLEDLRREWSETAPSENHGEAQVSAN